MVSDGTEFAVGDIERLFEEARRNTKAKHEKWEKYYNRHRRDVQIKVRIYSHRKCDETKIGTGSLDNGSLRDESSGFDRVQQRSNESQDGKKKESEKGEKGGESRLTIERKTQQGRPVRSRKGRERNDSPYIEKRARSSNKNARRGGDQQRQEQERRVACTKKSLSLEVLVGNANYK
ncbi:uncharacterized protein TNCV_2487751 [Trichonephila clavipes]|uniref:Uncharacterized protein n=1 Tax=Trichonephila clavipes TaxID=2585209 RepID=A0A8X6VZZ4_TRICX|nr:uncharacterized protein TNCV_2487751 [Trichonephila clavipes]